MAKRLADGSILMDDGRIIYANCLLLAKDFAELLPLFTPPPVWPFISGGGGGGVGTPGPQGVPGPAGPPGLECIPARTLFVSQAWPAGCDPTIYFTTISAALVQAATLSPTVTDGVAIIIYPGSYSEDLTLVSNVTLSSADHLGAIITGDVTWTPGAGVNAPQTGVVEFPTFRGLIVAGTLSIDATGKAASTSTLEIRDCQITGPSTTVIGRGTGADFLTLFGTLHTAALTITAAEGRLDDSFFVSVSISGAGSTVFTGGTIFGTVTSGVGTSVFITAADIVGAVTSSGFLAARSCTLFGGLTVLAGLADIRNSEYFTPAALVGGPIDRTLNTFTFGPTAVGPNAVVFANTYFDGFYNVQLTDTGAGGGPLPAVGAKVFSGFTLTDTVGGRTFDVTVDKV